jgi:L-aspartate oxidase
LTTAGFIAAAALTRRESRGAHYRADFPQADPVQAKRSLITKAQMQAILTAGGEER